ncbi:MAG: hypothetical protein HC905_18665 [Bacteroidales bacterium]|nr:hypothetical protein [Bacteroidales bacterium]
MNYILIAGTIIVNLALLFYTIAFVIFYRMHKLSGKLLLFFSLGLVFDIAATCFMIAGSTNSPFTIHGFVGYSALLTMTIEVILIWRLYINYGLDVSLPTKVHRYTVFAYIWWILAYITGALLAALN